MSGMEPKMNKFEPQNILHFFLIYTYAELSKFLNWLAIYVTLFQFLSEYDFLKCVA